MQLVGYGAFLTKATVAVNASIVTSGVLKVTLDHYPLRLLSRNVLPSSAQVMLYRCTSANHDLVGLDGDAAALWGRSEAPSRYCARSLSMILEGGAPRTIVLALPSYDGKLTGGPVALTALLLYRNLPISRVSTVCGITYPQTIAIEVLARVGFVLLRDTQ